MTFIRPEVGALIARWRDVILAGLFALVGSGVFRFGGWFYESLGIGMVVLALLSIIPLARRARFHPAHSGPGIIEVTEGEVTYFGPDGGMSVSLDALIRIDIRQSKSFGPVWVLRQKNTPKILLPVQAIGAERLFDAFSSLSGFDTGLMAGVMTREANKTRTIWRKPGG